MMDLTPLDVRKKKGDFRRGLRGYEAAQVDDFLDLVADRLEAIVRNSAPLKDRVAQLEQQVKDYRDRERALTEALVSAQQMRQDIKSQSTREVEMLLRQAEQEADQIRAEAHKDREREEHELQTLRARQVQFLQSYRTYLEQELSELAAMNRAIEMHAANPAAAAAVATARHESSVSIAAAAATSVPLAVPESAAQAVPHASATTSTPQAPVTTTPVPAPEPTMASAPEPITPPAPVAAQRGRGATFAESAVRGRQQPAAGPLAGPVSDPEAAGIEGLLDKALARWEPELDTPGEANPVAVVDDVATASDDGAEDELLLSDEDIVATADSEPQDGGLELSEEEAAVDLGFLDFEDEPPVAETEPEAIVEMREPEDPAVVDREVTAAMGDSDADFIEIGNSFSGEGTANAADAALAHDAPLSEHEDLELESDYGAGFGADPVVDALFTDDQSQASPHPADATATEAAAGESVATATGEDMDFLEAVVFDAETAFNEEPSEDRTQPVVSESESAVAPVADGVGFDDDFDAFEVDAGHVEAAEPQASASDDDLIDMDSFTALQDRTGARTEEDMSSLTLHPMFFEEEATDVPGVAEGHEHGHEEARHDQWSSSGGG